MNRKIELSMSRVIFSALLAALISAIVLLVTFPGTLSPDSITSWGGVVDGQIDTVKPPLVSLIQGIYYLTLPIEAAVAAFSFSQGFLFWFSIFFTISILTTSSLAFAVSVGFVVLLFPLWPYTSTHWVDVWVVIFGLFAVSFSILANSTLSWKQFFTALLFFTLCSATRHNALSILPVALIPIVAFLRKRAFRRGTATTLAIGALIAMFLASKIFVFFPQVVRTPSIATFGLLNQYIGTLANSTAEEQEDLIRLEERSFDKTFGSGALRAAIKTYDPGFNGFDLLWGPNAILKANYRDGFQAVVANSDFLLPAFWRVALKSPGGFFKHKALYITGQFGSGATRYAYDWGVFPNNYGIIYEPQFISANSLLHSFLGDHRSSLVYQHWVFFLIGLGAFVASMIIFRSSAAWLFLFSIFYALPFLVFETGWEWRYLMPCYVFNILTVIDVSDKVHQRFRSRIEEPRMF